jgi:2'-5' RNA ligase
MGDTIRTFIAVELGSAERRALEQVQERLKSERAGRYVRWVAPASIHMTLKFLGDVEAGQMAALQRAVAGACAGIPPHSLTLEGIGAFPNLRRPNVIWVGVGGDVATTARLAEQIDSACAALGFPRETRPFSAHLTMGRVKRDIRPADLQFVGEMVGGTAVGELARLTVDQVSVMKSDLRPTGSVYTQLAAVQLSGQ